MNLKFLRFVLISMFLVVIIPVGFSEYENCNAEQYRVNFDGCEQQWDSICIPYLDCDWDGCDVKCKYVIGNQRCSSPRASPSNGERTDFLTCVDDADTEFWDSTITYLSGNTGAGGFNCVASFTNCCDEHFDYIGHETCGGDRSGLDPAEQVFVNVSGVVNSRCTFNENSTYDVYAKCGNIGQGTGGLDYNCCDSYWYKDFDDDGYAERKELSVGSPGVGWKWDAIPLGDCEDDNPLVNPGNNEEFFLECTNGHDDDCDGDFDSDDSFCQIDCDVGYDTILRYDNISFDTGSFVTLNEIDYTHYFPLCVKAQDGAGLNRDCSGVLNVPVLKVDPVTELIAMPSKAGSSYTDEICMRGAGCYLSSNSGCDDSRHKAIARVSGDDNAYLTHPDATVTGDYLCCSIDELGFEFTDDGTNEQFLCNRVEDGICPEDFENEFGLKVQSCGIYEDPDCGSSPANYLYDVKRLLFGISFAEKNYVVSAQNDEGALLSVNNETDLGGSYEYNFAINSEDIDSNFSRTQIDFSYAEGTPDIVFDGQSVPVCPVGVSEADLVAAPNACYEWTPSVYKLVVYHHLSDHTLGVKFYYRNIPILLLILLIFAVLIPVLIVRKSGVSLKFKFNKKDSVEKLEQEVKILSEEKKKLESYIKESLEKGIPKSKTYGVLLSAGWDRAEVDKIFKKVNKKTGGNK